MYEPESFSILLSLSCPAGKEGDRVVWKASDAQPHLCTTKAAALDAQSGRVWRLSWGCFCKIQPGLPSRTHVFPLLQTWDKGCASPWEGGSHLILLHEICRTKIWSENESRFSVIYRSSWVLVGQVLMLPGKLNMQERCWNCMLLLFNLKVSLSTELYLFAVVLSRNLCVTTFFRLQPNLTKIRSLDQTEFSSLS